MGWSYSNFTTALSCLKKYEYAVLKGMPYGERSSDLHFGSSIHTGLNGYLEGNDGAYLFETVWRSYQSITGDDVLDYDRFNHAELMNIGLNFMRKWERLHKPHYKPESLEKRLYAEYKGVKLEGTPDFIGTYKGEQSLRDFKTSAYNYVDTKLNTSLQLHLYAYLAIKELGFTPTTLGYDVFNKSIGSIQNMTEAFSEKKMYDMLDNMLDYAEEIDKRKTYPKNVASCTYGKKKCDFLDKCFPKET